MEGHVCQNNPYSEENRSLNTLLFCKFSHLEIMEGSEIVIVGACPEKNPEIAKYMIFFNYLFV